MKHVKQFEKYGKEVIYGVGDYIITQYILHNTNTTIFKIVEIVPYAYYPVRVLTPTGKIHFLEFSDIKRKLTKKEIEKFEFDQNIEKYNL